MRKIVLEAWQKAVQAEMEKQLPMFSLEKKKFPGEWPRMLKYQYTRPEGAQWAIAFRPLDEQFDVYVGWSRSGHSPFTNLVQVGSENLLDTFAGDAIMLPTAVVARRSGATYWSFWNPSEDVVNDSTRFASEFANYYGKLLTIEDARNLVRDSVSSAMREIVTCCIPYLEKATASR